MHSNGFKADLSGSVEGLPLQLLIAVVITGIVIATVLGWMSSMEPPRSIRSVQLTDGEVNIETLEYSSDEGVSPSEVTIFVYDQDLNALSGALVVVRGCGVSEHAITDEDGETLVDVSGVFLPENGAPIGHLEILVEKSGYIKLETRVPVVRV